MLRLHLHFTALDSLFERFVNSNLEVLGRKRPAVRRSLQTGKELGQGDKKLTGSGQTADCAAEIRVLELPEKIPEGRFGVGRSAGLLGRPVPPVGNLLQLVPRPDLRGDTF